MSKLPTTTELKALPIDKLVSLHESVKEVLEARAQTESNDLEEKLRRLQPFLGEKSESKPKAKAKAPSKAKKLGRPKKQKAKVAKAVEAAPVAAPVAEVVAAKPATKRRGRPKGSTNKKAEVAKPVVKKVAAKAVKPVKAVKESTVIKRRGPNKSSGTQYVDPDTGAIWAGRGRTPKWLVSLESKGRKRIEFLKK